MGKSYKILVLSFLFLSLSFSCRRDDRTELFIMEHHLDFDIPPGLNNLDTHFFVFGPIQSQLDARLADIGWSADEVVAVEARNAFLSSVFQDYDLDFIHRVSIRIFDPFDPSDNIEFYYRDPVPLGDKTDIPLLPGIANLQEWLDREYYGVEVRLDFRQISPTAIPMRLNYNLRVLAE